VAPAEPRFPRRRTPRAAPTQHVPPLLQLRRTYMLFEHDDGVVLIDQHSAHERVLYERFMGMLERGEAPSQRLLFPLTLHLTPPKGTRSRRTATCSTLGFEVEGFGGHTLLVSSVPMPHPRFDAERCLRETLAPLAGDRDAAAHARHERSPRRSRARRRSRPATSCRRPRCARCSSRSATRSFRARRARPLDHRAALVAELERRFGRQ
jgi:DNA mismatch repair protein MutL